MKLILTKIQLKQKGWFTWFFRKHFNLIINNKSFSLRMGNFFMCHIVNIKTFDVHIKLDIENNYFDYSKTFSIGESIIEVDNSFFRGTLEFITVYDNILTYFESVESQKDIKALGRSLEDSTEIYGKRISYDNMVYYVNKENYTTSFSKNKASILLPPGWEMRIHNKKVLYINHNLRLCYWKSPAYFYNTLREKIDNFENILLDLNFLSLSNLLPQNVNVRRGHLLDSSAIFILKNVDKLRTKKIYVSFVDEMGQDYGALLREYMYETSLEIFNDPRLEIINDFIDVALDNNCEEELLRRAVKTLAIQHRDIKNFPDELKNKNRLSDEAFYTFLGVFLALLILSGETIDYSFSLAFYENLLKRQYTIRHIQDTQYQKSLLWMLKNDITEEILPGIEADNKPRLLYSMYYEKLYTQKQVPYEYINKGFYSVIPEKFKNIFECDELALIISPDRDLNIKCLEEFTIYNMCSADTNEVRWLWEILKTKDQKFIRALLKFITGSGTVPMLHNNNNFKIIFEQTQGKNILFRASACLNKFFFGYYTSIEEMERILEYSVLNTEGFHKV